MVDDLAEELGRSVVINDPVVRLICTSRHFGDEDGLRIRAVLQRDAGAEAIRFILAQGVARWSAPGMLAGREDLSMLPRLCVPLRERGELLGLLMVIDADRSLTAAQLHRITEASLGMAAQLYRHRLATDSGRGDREDALRELLGDNPARRAARLTGHGGGLPREAPHVVVTALEVHGAVEPPAQIELALRTVLDAATRRRPARCATVADPDEGLLLQVMDRLEREELAAQARRMVDELRHLLAGAPVCVAGIGGAAPGLAEAWTSRAQASTAARGARLLPELAGVGEWDELGCYTVLLHLPDSALTPALLPQPLRALLRHDRGARLVRTLRIFLDHAGSIPHTAAALHLHRTSLYYRLGQIREITGLDLDDGEHRLRLHLGLRIVDLLGPGQGPDGTGPVDNAGPVDGTPVSGRPTGRARR